MIDLWATWCGPCRKGLPETIQLSENGVHEGYRVLAISNEGTDAVTEFLKEEGLQSLPAFIDSTGEVWSRYKVVGIPTTLVIDAEGKLSAYLVGLRPTTEIEAAIRAAQNRTT